MSDKKRIVYSLPLKEKDAEMLDALQAHDGEPRSTILRRLIRKAYNRIFHPKTTRAALVFPRAAGE